METVISSDQKIINTLLLNASFIDNLGLMHGKMGISILFYHLSRKYNNKIYEEYAGELIDEIYEEITANTPVNFENGLAGIGWGIEYLVQNKFIEADTDEVLEEFDNRIFKELIYNIPQEIGLLNGMLGIGTYFLKRIQNPASNDEKISTLTNKQTLIHIIDEIDRRTQNVSQLIIEPQSRLGTDHYQPLNNKTVKPSNFQILKDKQQASTRTFDITWDYPVLIWFLAELYEQNIFNFKVEKIIKRLIEPLAIENNLPIQHSNRLLLALSLTKLLQNIELKGTIEKTKSNLLEDINQETIKSGLIPNNNTMKHGTLGIAWIYKQFFKLTSDSILKIEMEYWLAQCTIIESETKDIHSFESAASHKGTAFGILEGYTGMILTSL